MRRRRTTIAPIVVWAAHLSLPLAGLWLLVARPRFDVRWEHHFAHFVIVLSVAAASGALAALIGRQAREHRDARLALVSLAYLTASAFLGLHALSTPAVFVGRNGGFVIAAPVGLLLASILAAASALEFNPSRSDLILAWIGRGRLALGIVVVAWGVVSIAELPPLDRPITADEAHGPLVFTAAAGSLLFAVACVCYWRVHRRRPAAVLLGVLTGFALLAEALVAVAFARSWQASWWEWHLLMVAGFGYVTYAAYVQFRREGVAVSLFASVGVDATIERLRTEYGTALESMVTAMSRRAESGADAGTTSPGPAVTSHVASLFGLSAGQVGVLEEAASALASEREELRRLTELVQLGRGARVHVAEDPLLASALGHVRRAFRHDDVMLALGGDAATLDSASRADVMNRATATLEMAEGIPSETDDEAAGGAVIALPITVKDRAVGTLVVRRTHGVFTNHDRALLQSFATQVSITLENARLYHQIDGLFRQYMSSSIVTALLADPAQAGLGGARCEVTSLFADLRGFTAFSERHDPETVVELLNTYFGVAVPCILAEGGTVTQFAGDNIMAVFNAPVRQGDHVLRAARAALAMQAGVASIAPTEGDSPRFRIGINSGLALVGNVGAEIRCYTANGDSVNLAARLEALAEPGGVVIGEASYQHIRDVALVRDLGAVAVKGRTEAARSYVLLGLRGEFSHVV